ncbi:MAG: preprotein translocase subunit SecG [Candidatus Moranbacteria bacterium]|jgi:protein translocase SecG subunit|nr:preprotein translocase subunit SecG [Candidatus Moranbacteria bacterium]
MQWINILQIIVSVLLIISILLQNRGSGLGAAFGGDSGGYYAKRGFEKFLVYFTVALAILFIVLAALNVFVGTK